MNNNIEELRQILTDKYLVKAKNSGFICPICHSGTGKNGTGIMTKDGIHYTCFANNCFTNSDIIDIVAIIENIPEETKIKDLMRIYGIEKSPEYITKKQIRIERHQEEPKTDTKELELLNNSLQNKDKAIQFLNTYRGINKEYLKTLNNIGYYTDTTNKFNNEYLTIKTSDASFIRRNADSKSNFRFKNYGHNRPSKLELLKMPEPVILVESYIDLMSIESIGYKAICLNSTANYTAFIEYIEKNKKDIQASIILCLDNDASGKETTEKIINELNKINIICFNKMPDILHFTGTETIKDINDLLKADAETLKANIENVIDAVKNKVNTDFETKKREWEKDKVINYIPKFIKDIEEKNDNCIKTGYKQLDKILDGGLYPALYTVGAISSLGKTNFILQMSDQIAQAGNQVLYFSLEMSKAELIARSISRITYQTTNITDRPKTTREILKFSNYKYYTEEQKEHIYKSIQAYGNYASNININEGIGNITVETVRQKVKDYIYFTGQPGKPGKAPVVFIDYLQLLSQPESIQYSLTDKQIIDKNILELKRISRDYETPIVVVSSFNRDNYSKTANYGSFKESGAIEYSSDAVISLEYLALKDKEQGQDIIDKVKEEYKEKGYNEILLKILKNRNGIRDNVKFKTNGAYNIFEEIPEQ